VIIRLISNESIAKLMMFLFPFLLLIFLNAFIIEMPGDSTLFNQGMEDPIFSKWKIVIGTFMLYFSRSKINLEVAFPKTIRISRMKNETSEIKIKQRISDRENLPEPNL
jgi:hypothetical protein